MLIKELNILTILFWLLFIIAVISFRKWNRLLFTASVVLTAIILVIILVDLSNLGRL